MAPVLVQLTYKHLIIFQKVKMSAVVYGLILLQVWKGTHCNHHCNNSVASPLQFFKNIFIEIVHNFMHINGEKDIEMLGKFQDCIHHEL